MIHDTYCGLRDSRRVADTVSAGRAGARLGRKRLKSAVASPRKIGPSRGVGKVDETNFDVQI